MNEVKIMTKTLIFNIKGMEPDMEDDIRKHLKSVSGVEKISFDFRVKIVVVEYNPSKISSLINLHKALTDNGYEI